VGAVPVLVIAPDERWLRVLEVSLKLGGFVPIARRSIDEASRWRSGDERASVVVLDLGADSRAPDLATIRDLLGDAALPMVVILPQRLEAGREQFERAGASVVVRPYQPSTLYAAIRAVLPAPVAPPAAGAPPPAGAQPDRLPDPPSETDRRPDGTHDSAI
jgi:DNA-binding response OmpR family regulator